MECFIYITEMSEMYLKFQVRICHCVNSVYITGIPKLDTYKFHLQCGYYNCPSVPAFYQESTVSLTC
jgi:hypothetical protein